MAMESLANLRTHFPGQRSEIEQKDIWSLSERYRFPHFFADEFFGKFSERNQIVGNALESLCNAFLQVELRFEILASL